MTYIPATSKEQNDLLRTTGASSIDELFADVPANLLNPAVDIPPGLPELPLRQHITELGAENRGAAVSACFAGYGAYDHFIPAAVDALASRGEFVTSYTPYQAEISQGNLQAVYEYQTMIADLCGCEVANASLWDGATALFEAAMMAIRIIRKRHTLIVDAAIHPAYRATLATFSQHLDVTLVEVPCRNGQSDNIALAAAITPDTAGVLTAMPNVFGEVRPLQDLAEAAHAAKALLVCSTHPLAAGVIEAPGRMGADIVCGEGQPLGMPLSYGGPYLGFLACRAKHARSIPGRLVGATVDADGRRAFCLALQTREQHIRREKATSNICTNQALCALRAAIYLATLGETGVRRVAEHCVSRAADLKSRIAAVPGCTIRWDYPSFNEFVVHTDRPAAEIIAVGLERGIVAGVDISELSDDGEQLLLVAATEKQDDASVATLLQVLEGAAS